jgi:arthrofactin-type cyclic lipopeptide synthetase B
VLPGIVELREHLKTQLPDYMLPATITFLDALPLTSSGKLDRNALPAPTASAYAVRGYEAPLGELENTLARIWADILKVERVGRHDDFFELGGHSLLVVSLIERLSREGLRTEVHTLFMAPTPASLAVVLRQEPAQGSLRVEKENGNALKSVDLLI